MISIVVEKTACFDVDCQYTFTPECQDELPVPGALEIVPELNRQAQFAQFRLASKEAHSPEAVWIADDKHPQLTSIQGQNVDYRWVAHAVPGTKGFEWIAGLPTITQYDYVVWKGVELDMHPYGSCYHDFAEKLSTGVIEFLRSKKVDTVIVGGLATEYCVYQTVMQLVRAGFRVILNLGASRGIYPDKVAACLRKMQEQNVIVIQSSGELIKE